jgi:hypothetical protein
LQERLFACALFAASACDDGGSRTRTIPDGFLTTDEPDLASTTPLDVGAAPASDLAGRDLAARDLAAAPAADLAGVDQARTPAADLASAGTDGSQSGGATPDKCADAVELVSGIELLNQSTVGLANDATLGNSVGDPVACVDVTGTDYAAPDAFYKITVATGKTLSVKVTPTTWDVAVVIVTDCNLCGPTCVAARDQPDISGAPEIVSYTNAGAARTFYIVVDSAIGTASHQGKFRILATVN